MTYVSTFLKHELTILELITIHYFEYMKDFIFHGESHDFWEFLYVDKGRVSVQADQELFELNTGDIIFHRPNEFHAMRSIGDKAPNLVAISFRCNSPAMRFFQHKCCTLTLKERGLISQIIQTAKDTFDTPLHIPSVEQVHISPNALFGSEQLISSYLEQFLIFVKQNHLDRIEEEITPVSIESNEEFIKKSDRMERLLHYMEYHICEQLTINDLCNESSLSRSALQALFSRVKKMGAIEYFNYIKIERAKEIIRDGNMNFTEIAHFLSYSSLQYFSKRFKQETGMSPLEYSSSVKGLLKY